MREESLTTEPPTKLLAHYRSIDLPHLLALNTDFFDEYRRHVLELHDHFTRHELPKMSVILNGFLRQLSNYKDSRLRASNLLIRLKQKLPALHDSFLQKLVHDFRVEESGQAGEMFEQESAVRDGVRGRLSERLEKLARVLDGGKTYKSEHKLVHALCYLLGVVGFLDQVNFGDKYELDGARICRLFLDSFVPGEAMQLDELATLNARNFEVFQNHRNTAFYGRKETLLERVVAVVRRGDAAAYKTRGQVLRLLMDGRPRLQRQFADTSSHLLNMLIDNPVDVGHLYKTSDDSYAVDFLHSKIKKFYDYLYFGVGDATMTATGQLGMGARTGTLTGTLIPETMLHRTLGGTLTRAQDLWQDPESTAEEVFRDDLDIFASPVMLGVLKDLFSGRVGGPYLCALPLSREAYFALYTIERAIREFIAVKGRLKELLVGYKREYEEHLRDREAVVRDCLARVGQKYEDASSVAARLTFDTLELKIDDTFARIDVLLDDMLSERDLYEEPVIPKLVLHARNELPVQKLPGSFELLSRVVQLPLTNIPFNATLVKFSTHTYKPRAATNYNDVGAVAELYYMLDATRLGFFRVYFKQPDDTSIACITHGDSELDASDVEKIEFVERSYFKNEQIYRSAALFDNEVDLEYDMKSKCFITVRALQLNNFDINCVADESTAKELRELLNGPLPRKSTGGESVYRTDQVLMDVKERLQEIGNAGQKFGKEKLSEIARRVKAQHNDNGDAGVEYTVHQEYLRETTTLNYNDVANPPQHSTKTQANYNSVPAQQPKHDDAQRLLQLKRDREDREQRERDDHRRKLEELQQTRRKEEEERRELARQKREEKERQLREQMEEEKRDRLRREDERKAKEARDKSEREEKERQRLETLKREKEERELRLKDEADRLRRQKDEDDRLRAEKLQREREERDAKLRQMQEDKDKVEQEKRARQEQLRLEKEKTEQERLEREKSERERLAREKLEREARDREKLEAARLEREQAERDRKERMDNERKEKEKVERERIEKEKQEREKSEKEKLEKQKIEKERLETEKQEKEKQEREKQEKEKLEKARLEKEKQESDKLEKERLERDKAEKERLDRERTEKEKLAKEKTEKERLEKEKTEKERLEKEKTEKEKLEREKFEKEKLENERIEKEKLEKQKFEKEKQETKPKVYDDIPNTQPATTPNYNDVPATKPVKTPNYNDDSFDFDDDDDFDEIVEEQPEVIEPPKPPIDVTPTKTDDEAAKPKKGGIRGIRELRDNINKTPDSLKNTIRKPAIRRVHLFDINTIKNEVTANMEDNFMQAEEISQYYASTDFGYTKFIELFQELITEKSVFIFDSPLGQKLVDNYQRDTVT